MVVLLPLLATVGAGEGRKTAGTCAVDLLDPPRRVQICDYKLQQTTPAVRVLNMVCHLKEGEKPADMESCFDDLKKSNRFCEATLQLETIAAHNVLFPDIISSQCPSNAVQLDLTIRNFTYMSKKHEFGLFRNIWYQTITVHRLNLLDLEMVDQFDGPAKRNQLEYKALQRMVAVHKVLDLYITSGPGTVNTLRPDDMAFENMNSVHLARWTFHTIHRAAINLLNVQNFYMTDVTIRNPLEVAAITWYFNGACQKRPVTMKLDNVQSLTLFDSHSLFLPNQCQGNLSVRIVISNSKLYSIPESLLGHIVGSARPKTHLLELQYDPIECCQEDNNWLYEPDKINRQQLAVNVSCLDIGDNMLAYNQTGRNRQCQSRNVIPTYLIVVIVIGSLSALLLGGVCVLYVLPRQGGPKLLGAGAGLSRPGSNPASSQEGPLSEVNSNQSSAPAGSLVNRSKLQRNRKRASKSTSTRTPGRRGQQRKAGASAKASDSQPNSKRMAGPQRGQNGASDGGILAGKKLPPAGKQNGETNSVRTEATAVPAKALGSTFFQTIT